MSDKVEQAFAIIAETITSPPKTLHIVSDLISFVLSLLKIV